MCKEKWKQVSETFQLAYMGYGIDIEVRRLKNGSWAWEMGTAWDTFRRGICASVGIAKREAENAYHRYVEENLEDCLASVEC